MTVKAICWRLALMIVTLIWGAPASAVDIAILMSSGTSVFVETEEGIRSVLRGNILTFAVDSERDPENKKLIRKMHDENIDVLLVIGSQALQLAAREFMHVPLVFCFVLDYTSIVGSVNEKDNADLSGVTMTISPAEQIKTLLEVNPKIKRLGIVYDKSKSSEMVEQARKASKQLGISLVAKVIASKEEAINAISGMKGDIDAYLMLPDSTVFTPESVKFLLLFSFKNQIALVGLSEKYVKQGALLSLSFDSKEIGKQAGELANDRLDRMKSNKGKLVDPKTLRLSINKNTAEHLNIKVPDSVIKKAYQIF